ncbi:hypothetical protein HOS16_gp64 [Shigella phage vB_SflS-ISF001]|uniref:Uncharacterized protein n=1 Tax=Shigella phage vB_SflS-ISF001 TaxID=2048005 RepID=A0A2D1GQ15_9CAUD|nr:hypothetical protein HOS16_gp64 [Shigella phage vB_SflS-ISF001]ATN94142.1 hypothetical protein FLXISF001_064 [Shigella phage vB_SflS-ISF001]
METQIDVVVVLRDSTHGKGLYKKGTEITIDHEDMVAYHSPLTWVVERVGSDYFLKGFITYFAEA